MYNFEKHCQFSQIFISIRMLIFELVHRVEVNNVCSTTNFDGFVTMNLLNEYITKFIG
jgi:hypothetical protein